MNHALVQRFERLYDHRTRILEGVRAVAFRNVDHLTRSMKRAAIDRFTNSESIIRVQDLMMRDQGQEPTPMRRWLLGCGTFNAWEIYLFLLFAELEAYRAMRSSFPLSSLDDLIDRNAPVMDALKTLRDKFLHPTKDIPYEDTLNEYFRAVHRYHPHHYVFANDLQALLDQYLRGLKDHLVDALADELARLPDHQLHAFLTWEASELRSALTRADNAVQREAIGTLIRDHEEYAHSVNLDPSRRDTPLDMRQKKRMRRLYSVRKTLLRTARFPTTDHSPTAVQEPFHEKLHACIPAPPGEQVVRFYRGSLLPQFLHRAQPGLATLPFRSLLLWSESLHETDGILNRTFPGMSHSEILELQDWPTRLPKPATLEEMLAAEQGIAPGMVALAMLAEPLKMYHRVVSRNPGLKIPELEQAVTDDMIKKLSAFRNAVFHVPDTRVADPYQLELRLLNTSPMDYYTGLYSGILRFFLRGDGLHAAPETHE